MDAAHHLASLLHDAEQRLNTAFRTTIEIRSVSRSWGLKVLYDIDVFEADTQRSFLRATGSTLDEVFHYAIQDIGTAENDWKRARSAC